MRCFSRVSFSFLWAIFFFAPAVPAQQGSPPKRSAKAELAAAELRGKKAFLQRCSICHLPPLYEPPEVKPYGPLLDGYMRSAQAEARARKAILEGTPRMPGFQYTLQPSEIDDLIAYMKTMKAAPTVAPAQGGANASTERSGD